MAPLISMLFGLNFAMLVLLLVFAVQSLFWLVAWTRLLWEAGSWLQRSRGFGTAPPPAADRLGEYAPRRVEQRP